MKGKSVGNVELKYLKTDKELILESGKTLKNITIAYETYGTLNNEKTNAIYVCHALSGDAHVAGWYEGDKKPGWWEILIGPSKVLDTDKYFIICSNIIGGCKGSTGPASINPETNKEYGLDFPVVTMKDMVDAQKILIDYFGIKELFAVIGGSMGGMQVLQWMVSYPEIVKKAIPIATTSHSSPQQIAFNEVGRQSIIHDYDWNNGNYYNTNKVPKGLAIARMIAHITYLSDESMYEKFGRNLQDKNEISYNFSTEFQVESYLHYQGNSFVDRFDANSYLYITKAIDYFDLTENGSLIEGLKNVKSKTLVISVDSDWLYPPSQSKDIVNALNANDIDASYAELQSSYGHDAFLLESGQLSYLIKNFLDDIRVEDIMFKNISTIKSTAEIEEAANLMMDENITHIPIVSENNKLIGIVTAWDLSKSIATHTDNLEAIMTRNVLTCKYNEKVDKIARKMREYDFSSLPVVDDDGKLIGIVTTNKIGHLLSN
ncbi:homoserine O-acetyltransferase MetX [Methanobrevibacter curvatus]|uniref:Homoserine O-acetyltransferase n=1 Tax=Methanobrevibacter curvatus TaxID=49547 RepID=A0A166AGG3_9EURY|nr:homoserine O-acetyltransferase [Methanobrevibacter curvatus]KZX12002.1 homoserine O-acetyltransferase [Methanobrevibacter curvatus]